MVKYYNGYAMRVGNGTGTTGLRWQVTDYLGGTAYLTNMSEVNTCGRLYFPFGKDRYKSGADCGITELGFTGQREVDTLDIYYFQARWLANAKHSLKNWVTPIPKPLAIGHFLQADTVVPDPSSALDWNRYAYTRYNPLRYTDPTGHFCAEVRNGKIICSEDDDSFDSNENSDTCVSEPWKCDEGYDPATDSIPSWGLDTSEAARHDRAAKVWMWLCVAGGWWGSGCPSSFDLTAWLLWQEGGVLYNEKVFAENREKIPNAKQAMIGLMQYLFSDKNGITARDLSTFTAFFNPDSGGAFTPNDLKELMTKPVPSYYVDVMDHINSQKGPLIRDGRIVDHWWTSNEAIQCTQCNVKITITIPRGVPDYDEGGWVKFGYKP